jgi:hypothetical protein
LERLPTSNAGDDEMKTTIELAREAGLEISHTPPFFIRAWEDELKAFADLVRADEREIAIKDFKHRLATAIDAMPFGDTAASFAVYIRDFK